MTQRPGLARRSGRTLVLTANGRAALADRDGLWRSVARGLLDTRSFGAFAGELFLALLVDVDSMPYEELTDTIRRAVEGGGLPGRPARASSRASAR